MISFSLTFNDCRKDGQPTRSGRYMVIDRNGEIWTLTWSQVHRRWNTSDSQSEISAKDTEIHGIVAWSVIGDVVRAVNKEASRES